MPAGMKPVQQNDFKAIQLRAFTVCELVLAES